MANYLFIDDSGSKKWETPYSKDFLAMSPSLSPEYRNFWHDNYFVLAGLHTTSSVMAKINPIINQAKIDTFGTNNVEIHSTDLRNPYRQRKEYLDKFSITLSKLRTFMEDFWFPLYSQYEFELVAVIVDKRYFTPEMRIKSPLEIAVEALFEQAEVHPHSDCRIIFDQMDSQLKTSKRDHGKVLRIANTKIELKNGQYADKFHHTEASFYSSKKSNFLQLADIVAYNTHRQFVEHGNEWDMHSTKVSEHRKLPMYPYFAKIANNFYHNEDGVVDGIGLIRLPIIGGDERRKWRIG